MVFNYADDFFPNKYMEFDVQGSTKGNFAFSGKGSGVLNGMNVGYGIKHIEKTTIDLEILGAFADGNNFSVKNAFIGLPTHSNVRISLGLDANSTIDFCVPIRIVNVGTTIVKVYGRNSDYSAMNNTSYPVMSSFEIGSSSMATIYLVYSNGNYRAVKE